MSALAGVIHSGYTPEQLSATIEKMDSTLTHRGNRSLEPIILDHAAFQGRYHDKGVFETDIYHENDFVVIVDGNIHNTREIIISHQFPETKSIAKIVFALYQEMGVLMLNQLQGSFAIAVYNISNNEILLCRDMFASRPLYFASQNGDFWFASEIKAILSDKKFERSVNQKMLPQELTYRGGFGPDTLFSDIYKVTPGFYFFGDINTQLECKIFIAPSIPRKIHSSADAYGERIWSLLGENIKKQLRVKTKPSIRTGLFLSGGIDSSLIALKQQELGVENLIAMSCGYSDIEADNYDETNIAKKNAQFCSMDYRNMLSGSNDDLLGALENVIFETEEPARTFISIPIERSLNQAKGDFDCLLTGVFADVFFGEGMQYDTPVYGFRKNAPKLVISTIRFLLPLLKKIPRIRGYAAWFERGDVNSMKEYLLVHTKFNGNLRGLVKNPDIKQCAPHLDQLYEIIEGMSPEDEYTIVDTLMYAYCWNELFEQIASQYSMDVVHPFESESLYKLSLEMPYKGKIARNYTKPYLRALAAKMFSPEFAYMEKHIFASPGAIWLRNSTQLRNYALGLKNKASNIHKYLSTSAILEVIEEYEKQLELKKIESSTCQLIFTLIGLEVWLKIFFDE